MTTGLVPTRCDVHVITLGLSWAAGLHAPALGAGLTLGTALTWQRLLGTATCERVFVLPYVLTWTIFVALWVMSRWPAIRQRARGMFSFAGALGSDCLAKR